MESKLFILVILSAIVKLSFAQVDNTFTPDFIKKIMDKNVQYFQDSIITQDPGNPRLITWNGATYYTGLLEAWKYTHEEKYLKQLKEVGESFKWKLYPKHQNSTANNLLIGDIYLSMYQRKGELKQVVALKKEISRIMGSPFTCGDYWWWVDALFMGPPTFVLLSQVTGTPDYLDFMHEKWQLVYEDLYDGEEHLFYRDSNWVYNPVDTNTFTSSGGKIFWSRGNGWAVGGICRLLNYIPEGHPYRKFYMKTLKRMLRTIASYQQGDGLWTTNIIEKNDFPDTETSGSALFCYAMAWGINNGVLREKKYAPHVRQAWAGLVGNFRPEGYLGKCQVVSHQPGNVAVDDTDWFGQGLLLLAAVEVLKMVD